MMPGQGAPRQSSVMTLTLGVRPIRGEVKNMKIVIRYHARAAMTAALVFALPRVASAQTTPERIKAVVGAIDSASIQANAATSKDWPTVGADYAETRYSKLSEITDKNAKDLGLVWTYSLDSTRGVESTPLVESR